MSYRKEPIAAARLDPLAGGQLGLVRDEPGQKRLGIVEGARMTVIASLPAGRAQTAGKRLCLVDRSIGIADDSAEYIGDVAPGKTLPAKVPDQPDFVDVWSSNLNGRTRSVTSASLRPHPAKSRP